MTATRIPYASDAQSRGASIAVSSASIEPGAWSTEAGHEASGVGGIFFDHLRPNEAPFQLDAESLHAYVTSVGRALDD
ncbi:MAG: hypothetical protein ACKORK_13440, partial [Gemmatimonadota bacterium]